MAEADNRQISQHGATDPISPIDFTPHEQKKSHFSYRFRWTHLLIVLFLLISAVAGWFVLTARSVFIEVDPITAMIEIEGGLHVRLGPRYLIRTGTYQLTLSNPGYHETNTQLLVGAEQTQNHPFSLRRLPGLVTVTTPGLAGARVQVDGIDVGETPLQDVEVEPGQHQLGISLERYLDHGQVIEIEGRAVAQSFEANLEPAWAVVSLSTEPSGADVMVDGELVGTSPLNVEILQGERDITLKLVGHKAWQEGFDVIAGEDFVVPTVTLEPADGLVFIRSGPSAASVTIDGEFQGLTPLEVSLTPNERHELSFFKNGYHSTYTSIVTEPDQEREIMVSMDPIMASVSIEASPNDAELYINGEYRGLANQTLELMAASQRIEIRSPGYVPFTTEFTSRPGLDQQIRVALKSEEQARLEQIQPNIVTAAGQHLTLFYPGAFTMGASRREAGRRPNETLREIQLTRPFYIGVHEVSNAQYRLFDPEHSSGTVAGLTLDNLAQPVVQVSWNQAALYCNWLSQQEGLEPFYQVENEGDQALVVGFNAESSGYRLPTEAEWAWVARTDGSGNMLRYPWGAQLPPPENSGNFADVTAQNYLGEVLFNYNDNYLAAAPVGSFQQNYHGIYDLAGNVSEWVHDFYGAMGGALGGVEVDPLGPLEGQFHAIRGSSWAHGAITELRLSFRDFGEEARDDVGFRVARYLEEIQ